MPPIRYALPHDFAALAKLELLGCDNWGELITKAEGDLTAAPDEQTAAIRALVASSNYGRAIHEQLAAAA